jgi:hypothetical protein
VDEERLSRWAAGITAGFFVVLWPATVVFERVFDCTRPCQTRNGSIIIVSGVVALMLAPVSALALLLSRRISLQPLATAILALGGVILLASVALWAGAAGALLGTSKGWPAAGNSLVLALVMAVYCAAVAGGSWMAAIGVPKLEGKG